MGLGKTLTSIAAMWTMLRNGQRRCLIVCPSSLIENWKKELAKWLPNCKLLPLVLAAGCDCNVALDQFRYAVRYL
jgi:SNF2 family DNA or RNA helicase